MGGDPKGKREGTVGRLANGKYIYLGLVHESCTRAVNREKKTS